MSQGCFESTILSPKPFMGNNGEIFKLSDGSLWEVKYENEYLYEYYPKIIVCPQKSIISIKGKILDVQLIKKSTNSKKNNSETIENDVIESKIDGEFEGWDGDTIFKLINGQVWQQTDFQITLSLKLMPKVFIYKIDNIYKMQVEGIEKSIQVIRLK
ncbi:hypothetical protein [Aquirufa aurantiipilula]|uniref:hypothetical protein n=1 Tax=Aquirufa aurantiipilula TaxID=2696561 RepID=UPI001CAA76BC|nr:hypothetical protein [Aquirufa aurantiipilula]MBZ1327728.1 hypothetical protein [Aquirufa aurantiipilula]